jgi:hypothetical protein
MSTARWTTGDPLCGDAATRDCVLLGLEAVERRDRAEGLLLGDDHVGRHIGQHHRLEEAAALRGPLAAGDDFGAFLQGVGDVRLDLLDRLHVDQRPDHRTRLEAIGDLHRAGGLGEALGESFVDAVLHQDSLGAGAGAGLVAVPLMLRDCALDRHLDIGVVKDNREKFFKKFRQETSNRASLGCALRLTL